MNKSLPRTLIGAAIAATCGVANAEVTATIFGVAHAQLEAVEATNASNPAQDKAWRSRVSNVSSELGFKGSAPLTPEITGVFAFVTGVSVDNANANTNAGIWANAKDVYVGIKSPNVGTLKLGRMTAAARWNSGSADFSYAGAGPQDDQSVLSGSSGQSAVTPLFNIRMDNTVGFESTAWSGFSFRAYYSANENKSAATVATGSRLNDASYSLLLRYQIGSLDLRASVEDRHDKGTLNNTTTNHTADKDMRIAARYTLPTNTILAVNYDRMRLSDATATGTSKAFLRKSGWVASLDQPYGQHNVYVAYGRAPDLHVTLANGTATDTSNTGASEIVLGYQYNFSKQFMLEAFYSQLANESQAKYDFDSGGVGPGTGARLRAAGAGLRYEF